MNKNIECRWLTPPQVARMWGVSPSKVLAFIDSGQLRAINLTMPDRNRRPRYRIAVDDLADFERRREVVPAPKPIRRQRKRLCDATYY